MTTPTITEQLAEAKAFAAKHLQECAAEIRNWQDSGVLTGDRLRELGDLCKPLDAHSFMRVAESFVNRAALDAAQQAAGEQALPHATPKAIARRSLRFFSYCPDNGTELHATAEAAEEATRLDIAHYRDAAQSDGEWPPEVEDCYWGEIKGRVVEESHGDGADYHLEPLAAQAAQPLPVRDEREASGVPLKAPMDHCREHGLLYDLPPLVFTAAQLREALEFFGGDEGDADDPVRVSIALRDEGPDIDGELRPRGLYVWLTDHPEEGSLPLTGESAAQSSQPLPAQAEREKCGKPKDCPVPTQCEIEGRCMRDSQPKAPQPLPVRDEREAFEACAEEIEQLQEKWISTVAASRIIRKHAALTQPAPEAACGCRIGECESKPTGCRMADEVRQTAREHEPGTLILAVDAAMVEMANIHPPLGRSECKRLILAAMQALRWSPALTQPAPEAQQGGLVAARQNVMNLIDAYIERPNSGNRYAIRSALMNLASPQQPAQAVPLSDPMACDSSATDEGCAALHRAHGIGVKLAGGGEGVK